LSALDLRSLLELLHEREVRFVAIGGVAVAAHGYVRGTADLDLVPDPDPENLKRVTEVLGEVKSTLPTWRTCPRAELRLPDGRGTVGEDCRVAGNDRGSLDFGLGYQHPVEGVSKGAAVDFHVRQLSIRPRMRGRDRKQAEALRQ
jgi:hypothetical protein